MTERLPDLPASSGGRVVLEGTVRHGVDGQLQPVAWPNARVEAVGYGLVTADALGRYRLPPIPVGNGDRNVEFLIFDPAEPLDSPPVGRQIYPLVSGTTGQVVVDLEVGARGSVSGRVELVGRPHSGGVIVYADGIPGADDLSGPDGSFFLHGIPAGEVRVGFLYDDYEVAPTTFVDVAVTPYLSKKIDESVKLSPTPGESSTAGVSGKVTLEESMDANDLELIVSPLLGRSGSSSTGSVDTAVRSLALEPDGSFSFILDFDEPHTLTLRSKPGSEANPIRVSRLHHVRRGSSGLVMAALWATYDADGDGYPDGPDSDGDGVPNAEDVDPDNDGCLNESDLTKHNPHSCGDLDEDGVADGMDPDSDGDGDADLEELSLGEDGRYSDHRNVAHSSERALAEGEVSDDGSLVVSGDGVVLETVVEAEGELTPMLEALRDHHDYFGDERLTPVYRVTVPEGQSVDMVTQFFGIKTDAKDLRLVIIPDCGASCAEAFYPRALNGVMIECAPSARGRKTCPDEPLVTALETNSLVWLQRFGPKLAMIKCGDGELDPGEECDDQNDNELDGCSSQCHRSRCGDGIIQDDESCDDSNRDPADACDAQCRDGACGDGIVRQGRLPGQVGYEECDDGNAVDTDGCLSNCLSARCGDSVTQAGVEGCDDGNAIDEDACRNNCASARCGDGVMRSDLEVGQDGFEACDDGNELDTDNCLNSCAVFRCGDGVRHSVLEGCDDGNDSNTDGCHNNCAAAICGDGVRRTDLNPGQDGYEECDDGNIDDIDGCLNNCQAARCGDQFVQMGVETCDDGNNDDNDDCRNTCVLAGCGDGIVQLGIEACDDGNDNDQDACRNHCALARCGDGVHHEGVEACDDGNANSRDDCLNNCQIARCGDGVLHEDTARELCDDGNRVSPDGCGNNCKPTVRDIALNLASMCILRAGEVWCTGGNGNGNLGNGSLRPSTRLERVFGLNTAEQLVAGRDHICVRLANQGVSCWGRNLNGQLGNSDPDRRNQNEPVTVANLTSVVHLTAGLHHTCAVKADGSVYCWGFNEFGSLGDGSNTDRGAPVQSTIEGVEQIAAGAHTCAVDTDRQVYCWGYNQFGAVGTGGNTESVTEPTRVGGLNSVRSIAVGDYHSCAVLADGRVKCWGKNQSGELGIGNIINQNTPMVMQGVEDAQAVACGHQRTCVLFNGGDMRCSGLGLDGALGTGELSNRVTATANVLVDGQVTLMGYGPGSESNAALDHDNRIFVWGKNHLGQLGLGDQQTPRAEPSEVLGF